MLLSSFGGDAFSNDEEEVVKKPKETRIKRIVRWMKKKKARKKATVNIAEIEPIKYVSG